MPITQDRMVALINAGQSAIDKLVEARALARRTQTELASEIQRLSESQLNKTASLAEFEHFVTSHLEPITRLAISENDFSAIIREETHFKKFTRRNETARLAVAKYRYRAQNTTPPISQREGVEVNETELAPPIIVPPPPPPMRPHIPLSPELRDATVLAAAKRYNTQLRDWHANPLTRNVTPKPQYIELDIPDEEQDLI